MTEHIPDFFLEGRGEKKASLLGKNLGLLLIHTKFIDIHSSYSKEGMSSTDISNIPSFSPEELPQKLVHRDTK